MKNDGQPLSAFEKELAKIGAPQFPSFGPGKHNPQKRPAFSYESKVVNGFRLGGGGRQRIGHTVGPRHERVIEDDTQIVPGGIESPYKKFLNFLVATSYEGVSREAVFDADWCGVKTGLQKMRPDIDWAAVIKGDPKVRNDGGRRHPDFRQRVYSALTSPQTV